MSTLQPNAPREYGGNLGTKCSTTIPETSPQTSLLGTEQVEGLIEHYRNHLEEAHLVLTYLQDHGITLELDEDGELHWAFLLKDVDPTRIVSHEYD